MINVPFAGMKYFSVMAGSSASRKGRDDSLLELMPINRHVLRNRVVLNARNKCMEQCRKQNR